MRSVRSAVPIAALAVLAVVATSHARADIYTWTDAAGRFNVSNVEPPKDVHPKVIAGKQTQPMSESAVAAAQAAELRVLKDRVTQLESDLDRANQRASAAYAAPPPAPVVVVSPPPAYPPPATYAPPDAGYYDYGTSGTYCDPLTFGCPAFGYPGFGYPVGVVVLNNNNKRFRRFDGFHGDRRFHQVPARPAMPGSLPAPPSLPGFPAHHR